MAFGFHHGGKFTPNASEEGAVCRQEEASIAMPRIRPDGFLLLLDSSCLGRRRPLRALLEAAFP